MNAFNPPSQQGHLSKEDRIIWQKMGPLHFYCQVNCKVWQSLLVPVSAVFQPCMIGLTARNIQLGTFFSLKYNFLFNNGMDYGISLSETLNDTSGFSMAAQCMFFL